MINQDIDSETKSIDDMYELKRQNIRRNYRAKTECSFKDESNIIKVKNLVGTLPIEELEERNEK